jgi:rfaE bifunctional protein nucleotidyltransferase chain/domain
MTIVFVTGTFDLLHKGHVYFLNYAKSLGDFLIVAIDSDQRVRDRKGPSRPINSIDERLTLVQNLKAVDIAIEFSTDDELIEIVRRYSPHITVLGSDWLGGNIVGSEYMNKIVFLERLDNVSTTNKIQSIVDR